MSQGGTPWWLSDKEVLVTQSHPTLSDPMDYSPVQAPLSMELSRQQNWSRLSFLSPGDLPDPANLCLLHCRRFFTTEPPGKPVNQAYKTLMYSL